MKNKDEKNKDLADLKKTLDENKNIFVAGYEKMTVRQDYQLRKTVRDAGGQYRVVKNNIAAKASEGTGGRDLLGDLKGRISLVSPPGVQVGLEKALQKNAKE